MLYITVIKFVENSFVDEVLGLQHGDLYALWPFDIVAQTFFSSIN